MFSLSISQHLISFHVHTFFFIWHYFDKSVRANFLTSEVIFNQSICFSCSSLYKYSKWLFWLANYNTLRLTGDAPVALFRELPCLPLTAWKNPNHTKSWISTNSEQLKASVPAITRKHKNLGDYTDATLFRRKKHKFTSKNEQTLFPKGSTEPQDNNIETGEGGSRKKEETCHIGTEFISNTTS